MKALTIQQPYAHLIMLPDTDPRHKRVENRNWSTKYRGRFYVHAGKSFSMLDLVNTEKRGDVDQRYDIRLNDMFFGAVLGVATLRHCAHIDDIDAGKYDRSIPWLSKHQHTEGDWCWILEDVQPFERPIPYRGSQGWWDVTTEQLAQAIG